MRGDNVNERGPLSCGTPAGAMAAMDRLAHAAWRTRDLFAALLCLCFIAAVLVAVFAATSARAEETAVIRRGDAAVTAFSGVLQSGDIPKTVHPLDRTFLDTTAPVLRVLDLSKLGGAPEGQLANAPVKFFVTAGDIGQVFGVTLDSASSNRTPNIYVAATSLYGLQIVDKNGERLVKGAPGAHWMPGQFGTDKDGGPGSIWKIDGATGAVSLFANIRHDGKENAGPALGALAYHDNSKSLYVADLETGIIHRMSSDGVDLATFDHGVAGRAKAGLGAVAYDAKKRMSIESSAFDADDPATWGFADKRRRVMALAVEVQRLYYSIADGPQIWSVGLTADGGFADDARLEIDVTATPSGTPITAITFDGPGSLYLTQRGDLVGSYDYSVFAKPQSSVVLRYTWDESDKTWSEGAEEFPIGLEPPHRATTGGLALSFGYTPSGSIDYGRCRETLWTTGEHLREGTGSVSGARNVHGLQGNAKVLANAAVLSHPASGAVALQSDFKTLAESANEPPTDAWFVDLDDRFEDADAYGHIGAVAIFNPCDQRTAAEPTLPKVPSPGYAPHKPGIYIAKSCLPGPVGALIRCNISVTNVDVTSPEGPIVFSDFSTILAGPGAGGPVTIASATPDGLEWLCSATPSAAFGCALPAASLPPGTTRTVSVYVDTGALVGSGNFGFRNCASLGAPYAGIACDEGATELTVTKTAPASCLPGAPCTFGVMIANSGTSPFGGDVLLSDKMFIVAAPAAAPVTAIVPPLACAPAPVAIPFSCVTSLSLAPGEARAFSITVTMPPAPANYWARNCAAVSAPGLPAPALPPAAPGDTAISCAWVPVGAPGPLSNLRMEKTPLVCDKSGPMTVRCEYEIAIHNDGPSDFHAPVSMTETVPAGATLTLAVAPWACLGGPAYNCATAGAIDIAAGATLTLPVSVDMPRAPLEAAKCWLPNTVALTAPLGGTDANFDAADDSATAIADAALIRFDEGGPAELVLCDPTNLATKKTAKDCTISGDGFSCESTITVTNMGPDPFKGTVKVADKFDLAPTSVAFSGSDWGCAPVGSGLECTNPTVDFKQGESLELTVTATFADTGTCEVADTATMTFPAANTRFNMKGDDDQASATALLPSSRCEKSPTTQCEPGPNEVRTDAGRCVCKSGYERNTDGRCVAEETPVRRCADGSIMPKSGYCPCPYGTLRNRATGQCVPVCIPGPYELRTSGGQCVCRFGYVRSRDGICRPWIERCEPGPNEYRSKSGKCVCEEGYERDKYGRCHKHEDECRPGEIRTESGRCVCPHGGIWDGKCPDKPSEDEGAKCPDGSPMPKSKVCPCPPGMKRNPRTDKCEAIGIICTPGPNEYRNEDKQCVCKEGYERDKNGRCMKGEQSCPTGQHRDDGKCVPDKYETGCEEGAHKDPKTGKCVPDSDPAAECRAKGRVWTGKICLPVLDPSQACKWKGGSWKNNECVMPSDPDKPDPAKDCRKKGEDWQNNECVMPQNPAAECKKSGGFWNGKRCITLPLGDKKSEGDKKSDGDKKTDGEKKTDSDKKSDGPKPCKRGEARDPKTGKCVAVQPKGSSSKELNKNSNNEKPKIQQFILKQKQQQTN